VGAWHPHLPNVIRRIRDGERLELLADKLSEMYGETVL